MSEYHKIETLYERDEKTFLVKPGVLKNRVYGIVNPWRWTEKVDGTNIRCIWMTESHEGIFGPVSITFGGKTDAAQIHADLVRWLYENVTKEKLLAVFPETNVVLYGEGYGAGIQKGGGRYSQTKRLILFDVLVDGKWWLSDENVRDVAAKLGLDAVPDFGEMTLTTATDFVRGGFKSRCSVDPELEAEGLVGRPVEALFDKKGARLIVKLKTKDFGKL